MDIREYEKMAKLNFNDPEREAAARDIDKFIKSFAELERIDTDGVEPLVTALEINNVLREDRAEKIITREELLANAPEQYGGYFKVPRTLE